MGKIVGIEHKYIYIYKMMIEWKRVNIEFNRTSKIATKQVFPD